MATAAAEGVSLILPESGRKPGSAVSPPRLNIPKQQEQVPGIGDDCLFSPGVDTPGHRISHNPIEVLKQQQTNEQDDSPRVSPGCLSCLKPRT
ncbi:hypothetical protein TSOC_003360 [Tetrabaena socialis]|uniref:Uncharacterized protein n=1 Tax=Tetrabaena socialis TaxID=47790 RepID=A0A2J8ABQ1_9CHLO|nr:hypothetical protein TSOC_003360 [Tetrabaena socialis]|eukprot:PNH09954.1 hypothetical protein TSOC_003360 [Tetrabaena socialis]